MQTGPRRQIRENLPNRSVKARPSELGGAISWGRLIHALMPVHQIIQASMLNRNPFRSPGGARGVNDVSQILRVKLLGQVIRSRDLALNQSIPISIKTNYLRQICISKLLTQERLSQQHRHFRIGQHVGKPFGWIGWIHW